MVRVCGDDAALIVKQVIYEDFINYKRPSMLIAFPQCDWKCGDGLCQNKKISGLPDIETDSHEIVSKYMSNPITSALVCGGLEPFDSYEDLIELVKAFRLQTSDPCVIFTGYTETEISHYKDLYEYKNIIIKYGRFIPHHKPHYDHVLGVYLSSDNQYAKQIS